MANDQIEPVKLIGVAHGNGYWTELAPKMENLTRTSRRLGVEMSPAFLNYLQGEIKREQLIKARTRLRRKTGKFFEVPKHQFPPHEVPWHMVDFWKEVLRFAEAKKLVVVPLVSNRMYDVVAQTARRTLTGYEVPDRVKISMQERNIARNIRLKRADTVMAGDDHIFGLESELARFKRTSNVIHRESEFDSSEVKEARVVEAKRLEERRKRNIARKLL
ncbi:MAG: hypothetical protein V1722_03815 [Candidatus Micrarchaeota archaeon]